MVSEKKEQPGEEEKLEKLIKKTCSDAEKRPYMD